MKHLPHSAIKFSSRLRSMAAFVVSTVLVAMVLMFSLVVLAVILVAGAIAGAYLWWKTRELRKQMRDLPPREVMREEKMGDGNVFEGEAVRVIDSEDKR